MKYTVQGFGEISLSNKNFLAKGGEGSVFVKGNTAYKIYENPKDMIPAAKIKELSVLDIPQIINPKAIILDKKNVPVGYTMDYVKHTTPLVTLFTKSFKQKNHVTPEMSLELVKVLQKIIAYLHKHSVLGIDINENNFLANRKFNDIFAIDTNGFQTRNFPATVIMPSVRDWHSSKFNEHTDWFSWAIITFQLLIGVHPYKGKHPDFNSVSKTNRMEARMKKNVSIFDSKANWPRVCFPADSIPASLRQWYKAVFEDGHRSLPPLDYKAIAQLITKIKEISGSNLFNIKHLADFDSEIINIFCSGDNRVVVTSSGVNFKDKKLAMKNPKIAFTPKMNWPIAAYLDGNTVKLLDIQNNRPIDMISDADAILESGGRIYLKTGTYISEVILTEAKDIMAAVKVVGQVLDNAKVYDGVVIQNMLGRHVASTFPASGEHYQTDLPELDDYRIIDAKYDKKVLIIVGLNKKGTYDRFVLRFSTDRTKYDLRVVEDISYNGLNFAVADHGVCVLMNEDEKIEAFQNVRTAPQVKILDDPVIDSNMKFFHDGSTILLAEDKKLYSITMK